MDMGKLIDGQWTNEWYKADPRGHFVRDETKFRSHFSADGSSGFRPEAGRYHLYVSLACPWAHRTLIVRKLRGLEEVISLSVVHPYMGENGWEFREAPGTIPDGVNGARYLHEVYTKAKPDYSGRVTVPVLWDKQSNTIVCNESRQIARMFQRELPGLGDDSVDLCPPSLEADVEREIDALYKPVNNGVYRAGFATTQEAYDEAVTQLFDALEGYEARLRTQRYLLGSVLTEADIFFFTTLLRFDPVYHYHFKCNLKRIGDYPHLASYLRDVYQVRGVAETCNMQHIKEHYYTSHPQINPSRIVPKGPFFDLSLPHDRARLQ